jgi:hypothetical protein
MGNLLLDRSLNDDGFLFSPSCVLGDSVRRISQIKVLSDRKANSIMK